MSSQSGTDNDKGKGKYTGKTTQKKRKEGQGGKLGIEFDQETWKAVGRNHGTWARDLGLLARTHIPIRCEVPFNKLDEKVKAPVYQGMLDRYHFTLTPQIKQAMDGQMASQMRNWRCDMHNHFRDVGGEVNPQIAKTIPHKDIINIDDWIWLCDYWSNETQIDVATRNKDNRKKRDAYLSSHGSKSFSAHRADLVNPETSHFVGDIEFHRLMYTSHKTNTWCDPQAEADYVDMLKIKESQSQHSSDVSSSESHNINLSEEEIVRRVRKPRPGYVKGKGRVIKGSSSFFDGLSAAHTKEMNDMKTKLSTYETQLTYTMSFIKQMTEKWNIQFPGTCPTFDANMFAQPPQDDAGTSASQPNPPNTSQQGENNNNFDDCYHPSPPRDPFN